MSPDSSDSRFTDVPPRLIWLVTSAPCAARAWASISPSRMFSVKSFEPTVMLTPSRALASTCESVVVSVVVSSSLPQAASTRPAVARRARGAKPRERARVTTGSWIGYMDVRAGTDAGVQTDSQQTAMAPHHGAPGKVRRVKALGTVVVDHNNLGHGSLLGTSRVPDCNLTVTWRPTSTGGDGRLEGGVDGGVAGTVGVHRRPGLRCHPLRTARLAGKQPLSCDDALRGSPPALLSAGVDGQCGRALVRHRAGATRCRRRCRAPRPPGRPARRAPRRRPASHGRRGPPPGARATARRRARRQCAGR